MTSPFCEVLGIGVGPTTGLDAAESITISTYDDLYGQFITELRFADATSTCVRVDSFPFLYSLIRQLYLISSVEHIRVDIGEGYSLLGSVSADDVTLELVFDGASCLRWHLSVGELVLFLSRVVAALASSIDGAGVDAARYLRALPPPLF